jgi:hypothetical protein
MRHGSLCLPVPARRPGLSVQIPAETFDRIFVALILKGFFDLPDRFLPKLAKFAACGKNLISSYFQNPLLIFSRMIAIFSKYANSS